MAYNKEGKALMEANDKEPILCNHLIDFVSLFAKTDLRTHAGFCQFIQDFSLEEFFPLEWVKDKVPVFTLFHKFGCIL
ncbi:MAG: hypothetical protein AAF587_45100, partial [Bacteroidota bacterium]